MKAMIFAAGLGTRLKPFTEAHPKALFPVAGVPLLKRVASRLFEGGIESLVINTHHFAGQIEEYVSRDPLLSTRCALSPEPGLLLETGGGILNARQYLEGSGPFLAHNVDVLSNLDLHRFIADHRPDTLATLVVSERKTSRYLLFDEEMRLTGWTDLRTGEVRSPFPGLDPARNRMLAFAGIHLLSDRVFSAMEACGFSGRFSIIDFYLQAAARYPIYGFVPEGFRMMDVGKVETLGQAEAFARALDART